MRQICTDAIDDLASVKKSDINGVIATYHTSGFGIFLRVSIKRRNVLHRCHEWVADVKQLICKKYVRS